MQLCICNCYSMQISHLKSLIAQWHAIDFHEYSPITHICIL